MELFDSLGKEQERKDAPLADFMRPSSLDQYFGQTHLVGPGMPIRLLMEHKRPLSMIFWGPPGTGKTTLARLYARAIDGELHELSAVSSGVADVRRILEKAAANRKMGQRTLLFIDEIHRFNKSQQDALLHAVEDGTVFLIGATTENPSFEVISALLSRCRLYTLNSLSDDEAAMLLGRISKAYQEKTSEQIKLADGSDQLLIRFAAGDARELINGLELAAYLTRPGEDGVREIGTSQIGMAFQRKAVRYDKDGDQHYDTISAFIKSVRGSEPDAAVYYLACMLEAGEEPRFIARRLVILASEDIGNADPFALVMANATFNAVHVIGMPEARIILSQTTLYLAGAPKSNSAYKAIAAASEAVRERPNEPIPLKLRNAPTQMMKDAGYKEGYQYPHDFPGGYVVDQYLPDRLKDRQFYVPVARGREQRMLAYFKQIWQQLKSVYKDADPPDADNSKA